MRVQSARAKNTRRVEFMFQRLLNALLHRVERCENGHVQAHGRTGLLRPTKHSGLSASGVDHLPDCACVTERRPNPTLSTMPLNQGHACRVWQIENGCSLGH